MDVHLLHYANIRISELPVICVQTCSALGVHPRIVPCVTWDGLDFSKYIVLWCFAVINETSLKDIAQKRLVVFIHAPRKVFKSKETLFQKLRCRQL